MIITRSPLRITLGGGGTDLPSYYRESGGFLVAAAIDKYVYVTITRPFEPGIYLKYSSLEHVSRIEDVRHPIIREALAMETQRQGLPADEPPAAPRIEITTLADIPAGTGLGSSGSFTTALLKALYLHRRRTLESRDLAEMACDIEIQRLGEPIGKQDQYLSAFGGLTCLTFHRDEQVSVEALRLPPAAQLELEDNLLLFFTGFTRRAGSILDDQVRRTAARDPALIANLDEVKMLGHRSREALEAGCLTDFAELLSRQWEHKKRRTDAASNSRIDSWYSLGMSNGALGGKLVGAGGGGFLLFYAEDRGRLRRTMAAAGLEEMRFRFDFEGTRAVL